MIAGWTGKIEAGGVSGRFSGVGLMGTGTAIQLPDLEFPKQTSAH